MWLKEIIRRVRSPRIDSNDQSSASRGSRRVALVVARPELAAVISELYHRHGYEVFVPETPLDVIETLAVVGDQVRAVLISSESELASCVRELIAKEYTRIDRVMLVS